jgi:hypothetical protein
MYITSESVQFGVETGKGGKLRRGSAFNAEEKVSMLYKSLLRRCSPSSMIKVKHFFAKLPRFFVSLKNDGIEPSSSHG